MELEAARALLLDGLDPVPAEEVSLAEADGRVLASELRARWPWPRFDLSPVDGYAVRAVDLAEPFLRLRGATMAGSWPSEPVGAGEAHRVATGAPIPAGADTVLPQELTEVVGEELRVKRTLAKGSNFRPRGEELAAGDLLLPVGSLLGPGGVALLAAQGYARPPVRRRPRVALLVTGDEVRPLGEELRPGQIYDSNRYALAGLLREAGAEPLLVPAAPDRPEELGAALAAVPPADLYLSTGGVSVGPRDFVATALPAAGGEILFHGLALRPGTPTLGGRLHGRPYLGLSGNPTAAVTLFHLLVRPVLDRLLGRPEGPRPTVGFLIEAVNRRAARVPRYVLARVGLQEGCLVIRAQASLSSGSVTALKDYNALFVHPAGRDQLSAGEALTVLLLGEVEVWD